MWGKHNIYFEVLQLCDYSFILFHICSSRTNKGPKSQAIVELKAKIDNDVFYEDKKQEKGNFLVTTLYRPAIPRWENQLSSKFLDYYFCTRRRSIFQT